jgi:hypothetical protein
MRKPIKCRVCPDSELLYSRRQGWKDRYLHILGFTSMRCTNCQQRTYVHFRIIANAHDPREH